jgi:hypothetical protein
LAGQETGEKKRESSDIKSRAKKKPRSGAKHSKIDYKKRGKGRRGGRTRYQHSWGGIMLSAERNPIQNIGTVCG